MLKKRAMFACLSSILLWIYPTPVQAKQSFSDQVYQNEPPPHQLRLTDIPLHLISDIKESTLNKWSFTALVLGTSLTLGLHGLDSKTQKKLSSKDILGKTNDVIDVAGSTYILGSSVLMNFGVSRFIHSPQYQITAETLLESYFLTEALTAGLKVSLNRHRPDGSKYSFPSGHTARTFCIASVLSTLHGPKYGIPAFLLASLTGLSRLDDNKHFLTDVAGGAVLGTLIGYGTAKFHKKENQDVFIVPMIGNDTKGISVMKSF